MPIHLSEKPDIEIFSSAYDKLIKFSNEIKINEQETGGVLIGKRIHNSIVIFEVTGPGTNARHSSDSFSPDIKDAQKILNNSRKNFDVFNIGSWHTHRNAFDQLSMGDIRQMQEIVEDKDLLNEMICFIICFKQKLELHVFHMNNERKIVKLNYRILSLNDELLYSHDLVKAGEVVPCKFDIGFDEKSYIDLYKFKKYYDFKKLPFSFYLFNFKRINKEIQEIKKEYPSIPIKIDKNKFYARITFEISPNVRSIFYFPPEYPINPPSIFLKIDNKCIQQSVKSGWNSNWTLLKLFSSIFDTYESLK